MMMTVTLVMEHFSYDTVIEWNKLPLELWQSSSVNVFKCKLKHIHLISVMDNFINVIEVFYCFLHVQLFLGLIVMNIG